MALPSVYSDATLGAFIHADLGPIATTLGWTVAGGSYAEIINEALIIGNAASVADLSVAKARALVRVAAWRVVAQHTAGDYKFSADGASYDRQQMHAHAVAQAARCEADAAAYMPAALITSDALTYINDPHSVVLNSDDENTQLSALAQLAGPTIV
jgi:hypothetical protein